MGYRKSIKGDGNVANEELSHNRVQINVNGAGPVLFVLFVIALLTVAIAWLFIHYGSLLLFLLLCLFIGGFLVVVVVGACFVVREISRTYHQVQADKLQSQIITVGEVLAFRNGAEWDHLSAQHEAAKVIPQISVAKQEPQEPLPSEAWVVIDMHRQGIGFKKIAEATLWTEYEVRKLCNKLDGKT